MTDRISALVVILENATREDDVQELVGAILQLRNVAKVEMHVQDISELVAIEGAKMELRRKLWEALK